MGTAPGYSWNKILENATLENVVLANPNSVTDDVIAVNLSCNTGAIVKNARVLSGGQILNRDYNGYTYRTIGKIRRKCAFGYLFAACQNRYIQ